MIPGKKSLKYLFFLSLFFIPLAFWMGLGDPASSLKLFILRISGVILFSVFIIRGRITLPQGSYLYVFIAFLAAVIIPAFYSGNRAVSFLGIYPFYSSSVLTLACMTGFFLFSLSLGGKDITELFTVLSLSALVISVYGIIQYLGYDFFEWKGSFRPRIWSTLGNPNFLAAFLSMIIPVNLVLYIKKGRLYVLFSLILCVTALLLTSSRAGFLATLLGVIITIFLIEKKAVSGTRLKTAAGAFILIVVMFGCLNASRLKQIGGRYLSLFDMTETNILSRKVQYKTALDMFAMRPLFGWGVNGYYIHFRKFIDKDFFKYTGTLSVPGYPHNYLLKILVTGGIAFSGPILLWWVMIFLNSIRNLRFKDNTAASAAAGGFTAIAVQNMFSFSIIAVSLVNWTLAGVVLAASSKTAIYSFNRYRIRYILLIPLVWISVFSYNRLYADVKYYSGDYRSAAEKAPEIDKYSMSLGKKLFISGKYDTAEEIFNEIIRKNPYNALAYNGAGSVYLKQNNPEKAETFFKKAIENDPYLIDARLKIARIYREKGDYDSSLRHYLSVLEISPEMTEPGYNAGVIYYKKNQLEKAETSWRTVLRYEPGYEKALDALKRLETLRENRMDSTVAIEKNTE
ncbi:MAG: O-antigen ligase family protein [Elusimicrobiota bacterium]